MQIHLIRHGEVENPDDIVYADIPGFGLSAQGRAQATSAGQRLASPGISLIVASPLDRAVETAELISAETGADLAGDERLTEWGLAVRWRGAQWANLPEAFPGELEAYLADATNLPFCPESIQDVGKRMTSAVVEWRERASGGIAFVSHQDPIHVAHLTLVGAPLADFHGGKPDHCSVTTLRPTGSGWEKVERWSPPQ